MSVTVIGFRSSNAHAMQCRVQREGRERWVGVGDLDDAGLPDDMAHVLDLYRHAHGEDDE